jgi:hypothetical protein
MAHAWDSAAAAALVRAAAGDDAWLERAPTGYQFDILPLLVATDGAVKRFGRDVRRLRPNLVIDGVDGMDETTWGGRYALDWPRDHRTRLATRTMSDDDR